MSQEIDYKQRYQEYKSLYFKAKDDGVSIMHSCEIPHPLKWDYDSIRVRALLDSSAKLYDKELAPFEFLLFKEFSSETHEEYEKLISLYRDEYFFYSTKKSSYKFILQHEHSPDSRQIEELVLSKDMQIITYIVSVWQQKIDKLKSDNLIPENIALVRMQEKEILEAFTQEFTKFCLEVNSSSVAFCELVEEYTPLQLSAENFKLKTYFQNHYDLLDEKELLSYISESTLHNIDADIELLRTLTQNSIVKNNRDAEYEKSGLPYAKIGEVLVKYAAKEQDIVAHYRMLVATYSAHQQQKGDYMLTHKPFELYFDSYYADFDQLLEYYKRLYKNESKQLTQTPYYLKMLTAVQEKLSIVTFNMTQVIEDAKAKYIQKRSSLMQLKTLQNEYTQEVSNLIEEFVQHGELYINGIQSNEEDLKVNKQHKEALYVRYDYKGHQ